MGDYERLCPECGETLSREARQCVCGWGKRKAKESFGRQFDHRCTFRAGTDRCEYPVGLFRDGGTSGWCIFHRNAPSSDGAEIVRQSKSVPYLEAIQAIQKRNADNPNVRELRERIAARKNKPAGMEFSLPMREPGADESEVAA